MDISTFLYTYLGSAAIGNKSLSTQKAVVKLGENKTADIDKIEVCKPGEGKVKPGVGPVQIRHNPTLPTPLPPPILKRQEEELNSRRTSNGSVNKLETRPRALKKPFDIRMIRDADRSRSTSSKNSRSQSVDLDYTNTNMYLDNKAEKTFSVTLLVNESEKNKIVDMIQKAKTLISKKVVKVMGKKPKSGISNVEALETVLASFVGSEEQSEREDKYEEEKLIQEQEEQVSLMLGRGEHVPINFKPIPDVSVEEHEDTDIDQECEVFRDMEVSRLGDDRFLQSPTWRPFSPSSRGSLTPTLSNAENVPCPWGIRPDCELYPPNLRRPSSLYGTEAAAASSRPPSRQVSVSPSFLDGSLDGYSIPSSTTDTVKPDSSERTEETEYEDEYEEYEDEPVIRYTRPDSFVIPIGGVWKPEEDFVEPEHLDLGSEKVDEAKEEFTPDKQGSFSVQPIL